MPFETSVWPTELLELIFKIVAEDNALNTDGFLTNLLCVCQRWRDIGLRTVWTNVTLSPVKLAKFTDLSLQTNHQGLVRSLTVSIPHITPALTAAWDYADGQPLSNLYLEDPYTLMLRGNAGTRSLWKNLSKLATIIPKMVSMTTFSFYVTEQASEKYAGPEGFWLRRGDL